VPGLLRLLGRELRLKQDFERDYQQRFKPALNQLAEQSTSNLSPAALLEVDSIFELAEAGDIL